MGCSARHPRLIPALIPASSIAGEAGATCWVGCRGPRGRNRSLRRMACANARRCVLPRTRALRTWLSLSSALAVESGGPVSGRNRIGNRTSRAPLALGSCPLDQIPSWLPAEARDAVRARSWRQCCGTVTWTPMASSWRDSLRTARSRLRSHRAGTLTARSMNF